MAKLKAPLLSLGASGAIGKAIVYFPWKGLDCAREYVVPSNPKTAAQLAHRAILTEAVDGLHEVEAHAAHPLDETDRSAYALYASIEKSIRTWFNQVIGRWIIARVNGEFPMVISDSTFTDPATTEITLSLWNMLRPDLNAFIFWGTSKTSMINSQACDSAAGEHEAVMTGFVKGTKYYFQIRATATADDKYVMRSGIYYHVST